MCAFRIDELTSPTGPAQCALLGAAASLPVSIGLYVQRPGNGLAYVSPLVVAGLVAGYLAQRASAPPTHGGAGAGLLALLPGVALLAIEYLGRSTGGESPMVLMVALLAYALPFVGLLVALAGFVGLASGAVAGWLTRTLRVEPRFDDE